MDKGIFYLVCSTIIIAAILVSGIATKKEVQALCVGKTVVQKVEVVVTPAPTATPSVSLKQFVKPTVKAVK